MFAKQRGASFFSMMIVAMMAGTLIAIAFKIHQPYLDFWTIKSVVEDVSKDRDSLQKTPKSIRQNIDQRLYINQVKLPSDEALVIKREKGVMIFDLNYESRVPVFYNIDAVMKFNEHYESDIP